MEAGHQHQGKMSRIDFDGGVSKADIENQSLGRKRSQKMSKRQESDKEEEVKSRSQGSQINKVIRRGLPDSSVDKAQLRRPQPF